MNLRDFINELNNLDLSEIRLDNIGSWPVVVRVISYILAFALVLGLMWYTQIRTLNSRLDTEVANEAQLKTQFSQRAFEAANLQAYRMQLEELELRLQTLIDQLPTDTDVPDLLEDVTETGLASGLTIESIALQSEVAHDYYIELPINIVARGGYHDFATFVSGVAGLPRIVTLHDFTISDNGEPTLTMNIQAKTYRYREGAEE